MATTSVPPDLITLRGGVVVPVSAITLLLDLERRGLDVRVDDTDGAVVVHPGRLLSDGDKRAITESRDHLRALVHACEAIQ
jgi:hypothetical protein